MIKLINDWFIFKKVMFDVGITYNMLKSGDQNAITQLRFKLSDIRYDRIRKSIRMEIEKKVKYFTRKG